MVSHARCWIFRVPLSTKIARFADSALGFVRTAPPPRFALRFQRSTATPRASRRSQRSHHEGFQEPRTSQRRRGGPPAAGGAPLVVDADGVVGDLPPCAGRFSAYATGECIPPPRIGPSPECCGQGLSPTVPSPHARQPCFPRRGMGLAPWARVLPEVGGISSSLRRWRRPLVAVAAGPFLTCS